MLVCRVLQVVRRIVCEIGAYGSQSSYTPLLTGRELGELLVPYENHS
ncbi:hypothetical protein [Chlamydia pneumoniae]|nr:hypothetical protein [Chlamydia pneumoniae]